MNWKIAASLLMALILPQLAWAEPCSGGRQVYGFQHVETGPPALLGQKISRLSVHAYKQGSWALVPHQVDEKNLQGDFVLEHGLPFTKGTDDGWFDGNDEFVVDSDSFGERFTPKDIPPHLMKQAAFAWRVDYCKGESYFGSLLVVALNQVGTANELRPHVTFNRLSGLIQSGTYSYQFRDKNPAILGDLRLNSPTGTHKVIKQSKFKMPLRLPWFLPDWTFEDTDFTSEIESWQVGPLRTIVAVGVKYRAFLGLYELHLFSELVFSPNVFQIPTVIEFVFDPSQYLKPGSGLAYILTFPEDRKWTLDTNLATLPDSPPDQIRSRALDATGEAAMFYAQGKRPEAQFLVRARVDPKALAMVPPPFLVQPHQFDSKPLKSKWKWLSDEGGDLGLFLDFSNVKAGIYQFGLDLILDSGANLKLTSYGSISANWQTISIPNTAAP